MVILDDFGLGFYGNLVWLVIVQVSIAANTASKEKTQVLLLSFLVLDDYIC